MAKTTECNESPMETSCGSFSRPRAVTEARRSNKHDLDEVLATNFVREVINMVVDELVNLAAEGLGRRHPTWHNSSRRWVTTRRVKHSNDSNMITGLVLEDVPNREAREAAVEEGRPGDVGHDVVESAECCRSSVPSS
jgi:hypothetical protein